MTYSTLQLLDYGLVEPQIPGQAGDDQNGADSPEGGLEAAGDVAERDAEDGADDSLEVGGSALQVHRKLSVGQGLPRRKRGTRR